jgi:hypothetical protein
MELPMSEVQFEFWERRAPGLRWHPEVWKEGQWVTGSEYVMDAITGMGEDAFSCGEWADHWERAQAEAFAAQHGIDLFADNADETAEKQEG